MKKSKVVLDVPHIQQISEKTGFAACAEMVLRFLGTPLSQREIHQTARSGDNGHATDVGVSLAIKDMGYKVVSWWDENRGSPKGWKDFMQNFYWPIYWRAVQLGIFEKKEGADFFLIKETIDKGFPVIVEVDSQKISGKKSAWPYFVVIRGYSRKHFTYNDPSLQSGKDKKIEFKKFEGCWLETPFSGKSMSVILKRDAKI